MHTANLRFIDPDKDRSFFFATLRKRVDLYFREKGLSRHHNSAMVWKTIILISFYILPFVALLILQPALPFSLLLWSVMGFAMAGIGMSVMHDANHGAYSGSARMNRMLGFSLNLLGGSIFNWKMQHNHLHHTYTNIVKMDDDINDKLVLRFSPHTKVKWHHRLQFVYAFAFYGILTLYWVLLKDFIQFRRFLLDGVNKNTAKQNRIVMLKIVLMKICYFSVILGLPVLIGGVPFRHVIAGFLIMHFIAGLILTVIFQLAHTVESTTHPLPDHENVIANNWAIHQLNTTVNFSRKSRFLTWYLGGLNYQVEHHLFPNICHVHYPEISEIVKSTCLEFGIPYLESETFGEALASHVRTLQRFGKLPDINEAIA